MYALIDGNNFYVSCERAFNPKLQQQAVVVLSNNDGCVVARSQEAKNMGIKMGVPYFQVKHFTQQKQLLAFSSNYELYADMSNRMMQTIASLTPSIEIYSIDECFAKLTGVQALYNKGRELKETVYQWLGLPTCVGIAKTKTLAKFCNHLAKKHPHHFGGVVVWDDWSRAVQLRAFKSEPVSEIWGVGRRIAKALNDMGIFSVLDLVECHTAVLRKRFGVTIERTQRELSGIECIQLDHNPNHKQLVRSRSFGQEVRHLEALQAAVTHHIAAGAAALRQENAQAKILSVFIYTNRFKTEAPQYSGFKSLQLVNCSADTLYLNHIAQNILKMIYQKNFGYKKAGIILSGIENIASGLQADLWQEQEYQQSKKLMHTLDDINHKFGRQSMQVASELLNQNWKMNRDCLSRCYTTRFDDIPICK